MNQRLAGVAAVAGAGLGCVALAAHLAIWLDLVGGFVAMVLKILFWLFILSCLVALTSRPTVEAGEASERVRRFRWLILPLLILWLTYSAVIVASNVLSWPGMVLAVPARGSPEEKIRALWAPSGYMLAFFSEAAFWRAEVRPAPGK